MKEFTWEEMSWEEREVIIDNAKEEFAKEIDLEPLYNEIRNVVGDATINFNSEIKEGRCGKYIEIQSEELIDKIGMMKAALNSVTLNTFNTSIEFDKNTKKAYWWGSIDFKFEIANGGSNGMHVLYFQLKDGEYTFRHVK